jgi:putative transposase
VRGRIHPPPHSGIRPQPIPWTTFIHANIDAILACDFFTKSVVTLRGTMTAYVLVYIHLGSRRVGHSSVTYHPNGEWVMQQNRNAAMWMEDEGIEARFLLRDRDQEFPDTIKEFWLSEGIRALRSPDQAPEANAFCECFIGTLKRECLNHFVCFSLNQLDYVNRTWVTYYNSLRPHRGIGMDNNVLDVEFLPQTKGRIRCRKQLGGLIKSYHREAA